MGDPRAAAAIDRIERALARIESAAGRQPQTTSDSEESQRLREEHLALRGRVAEAISQIDQLLAGREKA